MKKQIIRFKECKAFYFTPNNIHGWHYTITYDYGSGCKERYTVIARRSSNDPNNFGEEAFVIGIELQLKDARKVIRDHQLYNTRFK